MSSKVITTFAFVVCCLEIIWGMMQILFYYQVVEGNYITDSFVRLLQADYVYQVSSIILLCCGVSLLINTVFSIISTTVDDYSSEKSSSHLEKLFCSYLWLNIVVLAIFLGLSLRSVSALVSDEQAMMKAIKDLRKNADNSTIEWMDKYQNFFGCCGSTGILNWIEIENMSIPVSCCKPPTEICRKSLAEIKENCASSRRNTTKPCEIETSDVNPFGCDRAIKAFVYVNAFFIGLNLFAYIAFYILWIVQKMKRKVVKDESCPDPAKKTTACQTKPVVPTSPTLIERYTSMRSDEKDSVASEGFVANGQFSRYRQLLPSFSRFGNATSSSWDYFPRRNPPLSGPMQPFPPTRQESGMGNSIFCTIQ